MNTTGAGNKAMDIGVMKALNNEKRRARASIGVSYQTASIVGLRSTRFVIEQGVTEASFYHWRKQLRSEVPGCAFALVDRRADDSAVNGSVGSDAGFW